MRGLIWVRSIIRLVIIGNLYNDFICILYRTYAVFSVSKYKYKKFLKKKNKIANDKVLSE